MADQDLPRIPEAPSARARRALTLALSLLLALLLAGGLTMSARVGHDRALARETEREAVPTVVVVRPAEESPVEELVLPGSLQAFEEAPIYARTSGYLVRWYKDIGSRVDKGELLARIDTPEVDQELNQALAARQQVAAQVQLAKVSTDRWEVLRKDNLVSAQDADQQASSYQQALANLAAAEANVRRLQQLERFKEVTAPFAGVLTRRNVDPGALITAGTGASGGRELFDLAQVDPLRVYINVPQAYAADIRTGARSTVNLQEFPGRVFDGTVVRTAESIDPATRTLLTEVDVPNRDGGLLPGSFGEVHFAVSTQVRKVTVPVNALLFRAEGSRVAVVGPDRRVRLRPIAIGRDYGSSLEVLGGIGPQDDIVVNPPDSLEDGELVNLNRLPPGQAEQGTAEAPSGQHRQP